MQQAIVAGNPSLSILFQSRFQDSLNCNPHSVALDLAVAVSVPFPGFTQLQHPPNLVRRLCHGVSVPFPGFTQLQHLLRSFTAAIAAEFQSRFQDSLNCNQQTRNHCLRFRQVSVPFPGFTQLQQEDSRMSDRAAEWFQSRFQDSLNCNEDVFMSSEFSLMGFSPVSRIHSIATVEAYLATKAIAGFSPVSRIHSIATASSPFGTFCPLRFQSRFQDSLNCNKRSGSRK